MESPDAKLVARENILRQSRRLAHGIEDLIEDGVLDPPTAAVLMQVLADGLSSLVRVIYQAGQVCSGPGRETPCGEGGAAPFS